MEAKVIESCTQRNVLIDFDKQGNMIFRVMELDDLYDAADASEDDEPMERANERAQDYLRLFNAAPAMLEALERVAECCEKEPENTCVWCGHLARAAIAQARKVKP